MSIRELEFPSYNGRDTVKAWVYTPIGKPRGLVQLVHGLGEHSRRYLYFILTLTDRGYVVCADDHVGHGKTAMDSGFWGDYGSKGYMTTTEDEKTLHKLVRADYPELPFFMFGHSFGSMIARNYAAHYGFDLAGLALSGTCGTIEGFEPITADLAALIAAGKGDERDAAFVSRLFGTWLARIKNPASPSDWISSNPDIVADHDSDPFNNHDKPPTIQANYDLAELYQAITGMTWAKKLPLDLPVLLVSGDQDPMGNYGEGVYEVANWLANTSHEAVSVKIFPGYRHELFNDEKIRYDFARQVMDFCFHIILGGD
ncbi:alpha/beta fold hydrolase [Breznakiellaceae bacterium SP9]